MKIIEFETDVNMNMSSLQGHIKTTYDKLVELFGKPTYSDADPYEKVNAEWSVMADTDEGLVRFSIYNWKTGSVPTDDYEWHIGGYGFDAVDAAYEIING
tara:strand:+ start:2587 stop:2886 length:300 start_codon:yes stop_codon:yes gene_type:complete